MESPPTVPGFASAEAFMDAFAHDVGGLISYCDAEGRIRYASRALGEWFGTDAANLIGKSLLELYRAEGYAEFAPRVRQALAGADVPYERLARHPAGAP